MNIRDLIYIRAVAKHGHFGRAAEHCHVSQPALSTQIKKLELELGVSIFERDNRNVKVTNIGKNIIALADEALSVIDKIYIAAESAADPLSGHLSLGSIPTIAPYLIPGFVRQSRTRFPKLRLSFQEDITERLNEALINGHLDAAILATPPETSKLTAIPLYDEPFWAVFPFGHDLRMLDLVRTQDLPIDELLLLSEGHCFRDQALDVCQLGAPPEQQAIRATSLETLINMVTAEQGITLVPATALSGGWTTDKGVLTEKLDDTKAYRRIYLTFRKTFPRRDLLDHIAALICENVGNNVALVNPTRAAG